MKKAFAELAERDKLVLKAFYENFHLPSFAAQDGFRSRAAVERRLKEIWEEIDPENLLKDARSKIALYDLWSREGIDLPQLAKTGLPKKHLHTIGDLRRERIKKFLEWYDRQQSSISTQEEIALILDLVEKGLEKAQATWAPMTEEEKAGLRERFTALKARVEEFLT